MTRLTFGRLARCAGIVMALALISCAGAPEDEVRRNDIAGPALDADEHDEGGEGRAGEHGESGEGREGEHREGGEGRGGEHDEGSRDEGGEGEESGIYVARDETWDQARRGARLVLKFNAATNAFVGTVVNTIGQTLCAVRVEVHLDGGRELGPTPRADVPSGGTIDVELPTEGTGFETWTAHPEVSRCESSGD